MHNLLDRLDYITEEMKGMQHVFTDSEKCVLNNLKQLAQNILKKTYEKERSTISGSIEQIGVRSAMFIPKMINPNNAIAENLSQGVIRGQNERDLQKNQLYLGYSKLSKKISHMNTSETFEFLDTFSKKDLYGMVAPKVIIVDPTPKRIEVKLTPVELNQKLTSVVFDVFLFTLF